MAGLVAARASALGRHDERAWLVTVADPGAPFGVAQAALFHRMEQLPVGRFGEQGVEVGAPLDAAQTQRHGPDAWLATIHLVYQLTGYDRALRTVDVGYVVARTPAGWRLADVATPGAPQPWDLTPLTVLRLPSTLVVGNVPVATLHSYLAMADAAHARIAAAWGAAVPSVVVAPRDAADFVDQLQRTGETGLDQVAAVTDGPLVTGQVARSDRVYLNPTAFAGLTEAGRRVVVTHELTHVTVRATTTRAVPVWLSEGYADQVGYATVSLPPRTVAADLLDQVRAGRGPTRLPADTDFDPAHGTIAPVYNAAWLAVTRLTARFGATRVADFYRSVAGGLPVDAGAAASPDAVTARAFVATLGTTEQAFTADWLASLRRLAS